MKGLKLSLLGLGILLLGCAFVISEKYMLFFPRRRSGCLLGGASGDGPGIPAGGQRRREGDAPKEK